MVVQDLWYNDGLLSVQLVQVLILELLFLWQLTDTFKEQGNFLFPYNLAINTIFFFSHIKRAKLGLETSAYLMN